MAMGEARFKILIVDDDEQTLMGFERLLEAEGYDTTIAWSAAQAFRLLAASHFDLILLDHHLPDMETVQVLAQLEAVRQQTPYVVLHAKPPRPAEVAELCALGAAASLHKRNERAVLNTVRNVIVSGAAEC
jgi:CheY-like chemotaxis protein